MSYIRIEFPFGKVELPIQKCLSCETWIFAFASFSRCSQCQKTKVESDVLQTASVKEESPQTVAMQNITATEEVVSPAASENIALEEPSATEEVALTPSENIVLEQSPSQETSEAEIFSEEIPLTQVDVTDESEDDFEDIPLPAPEGSLEEDEFEEVVPQKIIYQKSRVETLPSELEACVPKLVELVKNFPGKGISFLEEQYRENFESISRPALQKVLKDARQKKLIAKQGEKRFAVYFPA